VICLPERLRGGSGVSEVQAAFMTSPATMYGNHDDRALRLDGAACISKLGYRQPMAEKGGFDYRRLAQTVPRFRIVSMPKRWDVYSR
jgi:hypothetical protein